ncbi:cytidine deaminase [Lachnospiraceae bacterium G11]|nr:cytidine deaminase [Lachnospiraceae bacterium G11]
MELSKETVFKLIDEATKARDMAYAPYSKFHVGAALLLGDGSIITGCNIENASFGATNCAERTAIFKAVSEGKKDFKAIAIVGGRADEPLSDYAYPCGICRQVMCEFCPDDFPVIVAVNKEKYYIKPLDEMLPGLFRGDKVL